MKISSVLMCYMQTEVHSKYGDADKSMYIAMPALFFKISSVLMCYMQTEVHSNMVTL
jgi:hypothetical protein